MRNPHDLAWARGEVSASSVGGAPFLLAFGVTLFATGVASYFVPVRTAALIALFQGGLALPAAFWLERRMGSGPMAADNPLRSLSVQLAMTQIVALPAVIIVFSMEPRLVPATLAAIAGGHFLPYAWLQRTSAYTALAVATSLGAVAIQIVLKSSAFPWILFWMSACYWITAPVVYRNARRLVAT
jgi:hypothetical protein